MAFSQPKAIIIGAGIIGLMSALELLERGFAVDIFDQSQPAKGASWAGGGILSPLYPWKYEPAVNALARYGKKMYQDWNRKLLPITGIDFEIEEIGLMIFDQDQYTAGLNYHQKFSEPDQLSLILEQQDIQQINPKISDNLQSALYFPHIAHVRNPRLTQSILKYLQQHPQVKIHPDTKITKILQLDEQVIAVVDLQGEKYQADHYILAAGAWSQQLLEQMNIDADIAPVHGQMVLYKMPEKWLPTICMNNTMYMIPRRDGHVVCGSSMSFKGFDQSLDTTISNNIIAASVALIPELKNFPIVKQWSGFRPSSPNGVPSIGKVPHLNNMWLNVGHFRNGLVMAPASARLLAQQITGEVGFVEANAYLPLSISDVVA